MDMRKKRTVTRRREMNKLVLFLPAPLRAMIYLKSQSFRDYMDARLYSGHPNAHRALMATDGRQEYYNVLLCLELTIPGIIHIRRNSDAEKDFNNMEADYFMLMRESRANDRA